jgi:hypothetical protein
MVPNHLKLLGCKFYIRESVECSPIILFVRLNVDNIPNIHLPILGQKHIL